MKTWGLLADGVLHYHVQAADGGKTHKTTNTNTKRCGALEETKFAKWRWMSSRHGVRPTKSMGLSTFQTPY